MNYPTINDLIFIMIIFVLAIAGPGLPSHPTMRCMQWLAIALAAAALAIASQGGCYRDVPRDRMVIRYEIKKVDVPCVQYLPPKKPPAIDCTTLSYQDCHDLEMARRSDYLELVISYLDLYVLRQCFEGKP